MKKIDIAIIILLFILTIGVRAYDLNGAGATFDEHDYVRMAINNYEAFRTLDFSSERWSFLSAQPPFGKYVHTFFYSSIINDIDEKGRAQMISGVYRSDALSGEIYRTGRYSGILYGGLTIVIIYLFCLIFLNRTTAIISSLFLSVMPNFIAYNKIVSLDAPTSFFYTLAVFFFALAIKKDTWKWWGILGIISGIALSVKWNLALIFPFYILFFFVWKGPEIWNSTKKFRNEGNNLVSTIKHLIKKLWYWKLFWVPVISVFVLYIMWPWLWFNPIQNILSSASTWSGGLAIEPWFGEMVKTENILSYYFVYFIFTTPVLILILFLSSLHHQWKSRKLWNIFVLLWFATPFLFWSLQPVKHDGMRLLTMIYPPLAILAAQGLQHLFILIKKQKWLWKSVFVLFIYLSILSISIHPYYLDYYNFLIGGPKNVQENNLLEFDWFGEGNKEAIEWINRNAELHASIGTKWNPDYDLNGWRSDLQAQNVIYQNFTGEPSYWMINHRYKQYDENDPREVAKYNLENYKLVHTIKAGNGELGWIYKHR